MKVLGRINDFVNMAALLCIALQCCCREEMNSCYFLFNPSAQMGQISHEIHSSAITVWLRLSGRMCGSNLGGSKLISHYHISL